MATKKKRAVSKKDFVLSMPATMGPTEMVAEAKKRGIKLEPTYISKVRPMQRTAAAKKPGTTKGAKRLAGPRTVDPLWSSKGSDHGEEAMIRFLELAKVLGKDKAMRLLQVL